MRFRPLRSASAPDAPGDLPSVPELMRAIVFDAPGDPDVLVEANLPTPGPVLSEVLVRVTAAGPAASLAPLPGELVVHNPVRRSDAFVAAHPELLDVDHSGTVDAQDLGIVAALFGVDSRSPRYNPDADVNGDGLIDGEDASLVRARLAPDPEEQKAP